MDKYIGLDMDCKKTVGYAIVPGKHESSATFGPGSAAPKTAPAKMLKKKMKKFQN
jgi:hypothetical protein